MRWLKTELHCHCDLDPYDYRLCDYSARELIREAARLGYEILAITCHDIDVWNPSLASEAANHGITLIPGMEVITRDHKHVLVYNFQAGSEQLDSLAKIRARKREDTLVVAPHPYYPAPSCLWRQLDRSPDLFDAIEHSGFYTRLIDFNHRARRAATEYHKPLVGSSDAHQLWQLGRTYTWVQAEPELFSILAAIRAGRVRVETKPLASHEALRWWCTALWRGITRWQLKPVSERAAQIQARHDTEVLSSAGSRDARRQEPSSGFSG